MTVYLIAVGDVIVSDVQGAPRWLAPLLARRPLVLALLTVLVLAPMLSFRRLKRTTVGSILGVAAICLWAGATLFLAAVQVVKGEAHPLHLWPAAELASGMSLQRAVLEAAAALNVILLAFLCQMAFLPVVRELEHPVSLRRMGAAAAGAISTALCVTLVLAAGSGVVFGADVRDNVLSNFSVKHIRELLHEQHAQLATTMALCMRAAYLMSILASFPLQMQPLQDSLSNLRRPQQSYYNLQAAELPGWKHYAVTYAALAGACLLAISVPSVWAPMELVGATAGAAVAFILPGALACSMAEWRLRSASGVGGALLVLAGLLLAAAGISKAILGSL